MPKYILTVTLNPALDKMILSNRREIMAAGGKGLNVSRALHYLGFATKATGLLGGASGGKIRQLLKKENIPSDFVSVHGETRTNVTREGGRVMGQGPAVSKAELAAFEKTFKRLLRNARIVTFNGSNAAGVPEDYLGRLIRLAKRESVLTVLDSSGQAFKEALKARPFIIKPNVTEAQEALGMNIRSLRDIRQALLAFRHKGVTIALLSLASRGAAGIFKEELWHCPVPKVKMKNEVGCGDAFLGGFVCAHARNWTFPQALRFATACGTANGKGNIPGKIRPNDVKALLRGIVLKQL